MNQSLYTLSDEYREAAETLNSLEMDEQTIHDTLEGLSGALEVKAQNVAMFARNLESLADQIKQAEKQMTDRRKAIEAKAASVRRYIQDSMSRAGISKIECPYFAIAIRDNPPSVIIDDADAIPAEFMRQPEPPPAAPDKKAIAQAIKDGKDVAGAHMERTQRLEIK